MSQNVEIVSNLHLNFFGLKVRHTGSQSSIFVRTFRSFTTRGKECKGKAAEAIFVPERIRSNQAATLHFMSASRISPLHVINLRWGKVYSLDVSEDSQAVAEGLAKQAKAGIREAVAKKIES